MVAALLLPAQAGIGSTRRASSRLLPDKPNILLILTDDQRWDEINHMATVQADLVGRGVHFLNGMVSDPLCCPSRATILTGTYSHTNGIYTDLAKNGGGFPHFHDQTTIATVLKARGYATALVGKYLNDYNPKNASYIPPGWQTWFAATDEGYRRFAISDQGTNKNFTGTGAYLTDVEGQKAVAVINATPQNQPLFLYFAPFAPHTPSVPTPKYKGSLLDLPPLRPPSYNEQDVSDKPKYIRKVGPWDATKIAKIDALRIHMYQTLLSVDDWIKTILATLSSTGRLNNTLIVYMSDNGYLLGEHRVDGKTVPYEESIKVPFVVRWDAAHWNVPREDDHLVANVDLAETFAEAAGRTMPGSEGDSLLPLLADPSTPWRTELLLEHSGPYASRPPYCGVRGARWVYVQYATGEEELYDLQTDPYQLHNVAAVPADASILAQMRADDHVLCSPVPPGFGWSH